MSNDPFEELDMFICEYHFDRDEWIFWFKAKDYVEAQERLAAIAKGGRVHRDPVALEVPLKS